MVSLALLSRCLMLLSTKLSPLSLCSVSLLSSFTLAIPTTPELVTPLAVNTSALVPVRDQTVRATAWPAAPFSWMQRGIVEWLPIVQSISVTCIDYDPWDFPITYRDALSTITRRYLHQVRTSDRRDYLREDIFTLEEVVEGIDVEVLIYNQRGMLGKRHTLLSLAETLVALQSWIHATETAHYALLVPTIRRVPPFPRTQYRPVRIRRRVGPALSRVR